jgi:Zn-dependent protease
MEGKDLVIRQYLTGESRWEDLPTTVHTDERTISATLDHFSTFALFSRTSPGAPNETAANEQGNIQWKGTPLFAAIPAQYAPLAALAVGMIAIIGGALAGEPGPRTRKITGTVESTLKGETAGMMGRVEAEKRKIGPRTSASETSMLSSRELAVVAGSAVLFAVAFVLRNKIAVDWGTLLIFLLMGGVATIAHELGHRLVGRRYGYPSELQFWALGSGTMLLTAWIFGTAFAQPSRTVMKGAATASDVHDVIVRVAGPLVNLLFAALSFLLLPLGGYFTVMGTAGFSMNLLTCVVALMPVKPMDGERVFLWNKLAWAVIWVPIFLVYCMFFIL